MKKTTPNNVVDQVRSVVSTTRTNSNISTLENKLYVQKSSPAIQDYALPSFFHLLNTQYESCTLVEASSPVFGNECLRLANIVFQTTQTFPLIMGTYKNVIQYLRKELYKRYPEEYFHIILGQNYSFGFAIRDENYFAEIEQEQYRVIIFTTKFNRKIRLARQNTNGEMAVEWKAQSKK